MAKMGFEPDANHVERKFGNIPITLEFCFEPIRITFRSKLEARYANYLQRLKELRQILGWWYEPIRFEFRDGDLLREWTPDFLVLNDGGEVEVHETKGCIEQKDVHKFKHLRTNYPEFSRTFLIFAAPSKQKPRIKAMASQWATIRYANELFKQVFGSTKAGVL